MVELTEHELFGAEDELAARLAELRARGARIALDDAGAGYAGLQQLIAVAPDILKLDRSLVHGANADQAKLALLEAMISFASSTGAAVCGEGVEDLDDLRALAELDATYAQGYALARPAPPWPVLAPGAAHTAAERLEMGVRVAGHRAAGTWSHSLAELAGHLGAIDYVSELAGAGRLVADLLGADDVSLMNVTTEPYAIVELLSAHPDNAPGESWLLEDFPATAHLVATGRTGQVVAGDPLGDPHELAELERLGIGAMLMVPLELGRGRRALMEVYRVRPQAFSRAQIERARVVALQLGAVIARLTRLMPAAHRAPRRMPVWVKAVPLAIVAVLGDVVAGRSPRPRDEPGPARGDRHRHRRAPRRGALPRSDRAHHDPGRDDRRRRATSTLTATCRTRRSCASRCARSWTRSRRAGGTRSSACAARSTSCGDDVQSLAWAVNTLAHEAFHLRGILDEGLTECYAMQSLAQTAERLGAAPDQARGLAVLHWETSPAKKPVQYGVPPGCADGERHDLRKADPASALEPLAPPGDGVRERALERDLGLPAGRRPQPPRVAAHLHHLVRAHERRVDAVVEPRAGGRRQQLQQLARRRRAARADVEDPRLRALGQQPVGAHDVAHVGVVAARVRVAGGEGDRILAALGRRGRLAREGGDRVGRLLARAGVVERARADHAQAVGVGVEAGEQVGGRLRDGVGVLRAQRRALVDGQRLRGAVELARGDRDDGRARAPPAARPRAR